MQIMIGCGPACEAVFCLPHLPYWDMAPLDFVYQVTRGSGKRCARRKARLYTPKNTISRQRVQDNNNLMNNNRIGQAINNNNNNNNNNDNNTVPEKFPKRYENLLSVHLSRRQPGIRRFSKPEKTEQNFEAQSQEEVFSARSRS
jgi:hypothetical protein